MPAMKLRILGLAILFLSVSGMVRSQKLSIVPFVKLQCGYGSFTGYSDHTLFLDIPFDFVIPRNRVNNEPVGDAALYEWYSFSVGICYYLSGLGSDLD